MKEHFYFGLEILHMQERILEHLQQHWKFFYVEGIFFIILGISAIIIPQLFTVGIVLFFGWLLLIGGIIQIARAISINNMPGFSLWFFIGLFQAVVGYLLLSDPTQGVLALTILLTVFFAVEGIAKIFLAFMMRPLTLWNRVLFSGITSLLLSLVIWMGWPGTALWILGLLLGINMIFLGWSLLTLSMHHKNLG